MQGVRRREVVRAEGQMEFALAKVVFLGVVAQPGQLQLKIGALRLQKGDDEGTVLRRLAAYLVKAQRLAVKRNGGLKIADVVVLVDHGELHGNAPFSGWEILGNVHSIAYAVTLYKPF